MVSSFTHRSSIKSLHKRELSTRESSERLQVLTSFVYRTIQRFKDLGSKKDCPGRGRQRFVTTSTNIKILRERMQKTTSCSVRRIAQEMTISEP